MSSIIHGNNLIVVSLNLSPKLIYFIVEKIYFIAIAQRCLNLSTMHVIYTHDNRNKTVILTFRRSWPAYLIHVHFMCNHIISFFEPSPERRMQEKQQIFGATKSRAAVKSFLWILLHQTSKIIHSPGMHKSDDNENFT